MLDMRCGNRIFFDVHLTNPSSSQLSMSQSEYPAATMTEEYKLPSGRPLYIAPNVFGAYTTALDEKTRQFMDEATAYSQGAFPVKWLQTFIRRLAAKDMELQDRERQLMLQYQQQQVPSDRYRRPQTQPYRRRDTRGNGNRGGTNRRGGRYEDRSTANGQQIHHGSAGMSPRGDGTPSRRPPRRSAQSHRYNDRPDDRRRENSVAPRSDGQEINFSSVQSEDLPTTSQPTDEYTPFSKDEREDGEY